MDDRPEIDCPHCNGKAVKTSSKEIYGGRDYGMVFLCRPCWAYVGCHPDGTPKGTPANEEERKARKLAHAAFDPLWKRNFMTRKQAYAWLRTRLQMTKDQCHMGKFDVQTCGRVVEECNAKINRLEVECYEDPPVIPPVKRVFTVKREKWRFGGTQEIVGDMQERGKTKLRNGKGNMCCLGFICRQLGYEKSQLKGVPTPFDLMEAAGKVKPEAEFLIQRDSSGKISENSDLVANMMHVNDMSREALPLEEREANLKAIMRRSGYILKFKGEHCDYEKFRDTGRGTANGASDR